MSSYIMEIEDLLKLKDQQLATLEEELVATRRRVDSMQERAEAAEEQRDRLLNAFDESLDRERAAAQRAADAIREQEEAAGL
jgi:hypothetical protein